MCIRDRLSSEYQHLSKELTETQSKLDLQTEQNTLLVKETDTLHQGLEDARNRIAHLELDGLQKQQRQQQETRDVSANASADSPTSTGNAQEQESLPLYTGGPKKDPSAGRPLWCASVSYTHLDVYKRQLQHHYKFLQFQRGLFGNRK